MNGPLPTDPSPATRIGLRAILGVAPGMDDAIVDHYEAMLERVRLCWPVVALLLLLLPAGLLAGAATAGRLLLEGAIATTGALGLVFGGIGWFVLSAPAARCFATHVRVLLLSGCTGGIAIAFSLMTGQAADLGHGWITLTGVSASGIALVVVASVAAPVRAASIAFALGLIVGAAASLGPDLAAAIVAAVAIAFAAISLVAERRTVDTLARTIADRREEQRARWLIAEYEAHGPGWFWQTDRDGRVVYVSDKVAQELERFGMSVAAAPLVDLFRVDAAETGTARTLAFHLSSRTSFADYPVRAATPAAPDRWWSITGRPLLDEAGRFQGFVGSGSDLTQKRRADAEIARLALYDSLTGLANRQRLRHALDQMLPTKPGEGTTGLLLLDLDRFKAVNDTQGHQVGDELLKQVAQRLQRTVGETAMVGRLGGDEFEIVVPRAASHEALAALADSVIADLSKPYYVGGIALAIGCSVGIAVAPDHGDTPETLVRNADLALYDAKAEGRGVHRFYRDALLEGARTRKQLEDDLRHALKSGQLHLAYQPVVSTADERIVGYEALLRWEHPERGSISPAEFVPVAEECGLIETIGEWVLRTAVAEAATWPQHVRVAVNVSPIQFANPALPGIVTSAIAASGLAPERLELEVTEGVFLDEDEASERMFRVLKSIGVRLALDDFGTGYSSLGYLKNVPFDKIKIDQSFVRGAIQPGSRNAAIIRAIVSLADTLGMETTAEGAEQQDEIALIRDLGCSHIQGYVYGRPARTAQVAEQLDRNGGLAEPIGFKTSRAPRHRTLRTVRLTIGDEWGDVRLRDVSRTGIMIDGVDFPPGAIGYPVTIELTEGAPIGATIRWAQDGRAGLSFIDARGIDALIQQVRRAAA